jgi:hypothetical protein
VNFREEKSLIGTGDAPVRDEAANEHQPAMTVAAYSQPWVAALTLQSEGHPLTALRAPKWRARKGQPIAPATGELLRLRRYEYWASALRPAHFYHFETGTPPDTSAEKCTPDLPATLFCAA